MKVKCKYCAARLSVRDELAGKKGRCPECRATIVLEAVAEMAAEPVAVEKGSSALGASSELLAVDLSSIELTQETIEESTATEGDDLIEELGAPDLSFTKRKLREKKLKAIKAQKEKEEAAEADDKLAKKRAKQSKKSVLSLLGGVFDGPFWHSAAEHLLFATLSLALFGAIIGFLASLVRSAVMASIMVNLVSVPSVLFAFFTLSYPASCFWRIIVGSAGGGDDISDWPESSVGEWVFDLFLIGYFALTALFISAGIAKLREVVMPGQAPSQQYWKVLGSVQETNRAPDLKKMLFGKFPQPMVPKDLPLPAITEIESSRPVIDPGPAWWTVFGAMILVFPMVVMSCLDDNSPIFVPWSPRLWMSFYRNPLAWLVTLPLFAILFVIAAVILILGANYAPFLTFTLGSPLCILWLIVYGRLLGRLCWHIANA